MTAASPTLLLLRANMIGPLLLLLSESVERFLLSESVERFLLSESVERLFRGTQQSL